jgi:hypothetical protein
MNIREQSARVEWYYSVCLCAIVVHPELTKTPSLAHDFFSPQPVHGPAVFMMRCILHDWSDDYCVKILRYLRDAASSKTQLVIVDNIVSYACPLPEKTYHIPGIVQNSFPSPLLPNHGVANAFSYFADMQVGEDSCYILRY